MARYRSRSGLHYWDTLTNIRCDAGVSRAELAASVGVSYSTVYDIEQGRRSPTQSILDAYGRLARETAK